MAKYFNIGSETEIGGYPKLNRLGQPVELPEAIYRDAVHGGALLLTEAEFQSLGFTEEELEKYPTGGLQRFAPEPVLAKIKAGGLIVHKIRTAEAEKPQEEVNG